MQDKEKVGSLKPKKRLWHRILIYVISVLVATLVWLLVKYTIWSKGEDSGVREESETVFALASEQPLSLCDVEMPRVTNG